MDIRTLRTLRTASHYVCASEGTRMRLLVGPFATDAEAEDWVAPAQDLLLAQGELELAIQAGVSRLLSEPSTVRRGDLNQELGIPVAR
jgi:hypothetical protein